MPENTNNSSMSEPRTMLDDINEDLEEMAQASGITRVSALLAEKFCLPEEEVIPFILAGILQMMIALDVEFMTDPSKQLRRLENAGYNTARACVAAERIGWSFTNDPSLPPLFTGEGACSVTEFAASITHSPEEETAVVSDAEQ
jgi:hypothetical protein